jgi:HlyD family secretion protein
LTLMSESDAETWLPGGLRSGAGDAADRDTEPGEPVNATGVDAAGGDPPAAGDGSEVVAPSWWRQGLARRLPGSPERRSRALPVLVVLALVLGVVAGVVARGFVSPAQEAANAKSPAASLITARVRFGILAIPVTMRANVGNGNPVQVGAPGDLGSSLAVVTSVDVSRGQRVGQGRLLVTVAERPVFVFQGVIPVFRTMARGMHGPDIAQLQVGLESAGYGTGSDASGVYGPGTAAAVAALYRANDVTPVSSGSGGASPHTAAAVTGAQIGLAMAKRPAARAGRSPSAEVPLGEVVFVPHLPARVLSVDKLGATVGSGKSASGVVTLGSGKITLKAFAFGGQARLLRPGMTGTATSDQTGAHFAVRITSVRGPQVVLVPAGRVPAGVAGQNVGVTVTASRVRSFIVPVAAVSTAGSGQAYVTLSAGAGRTVNVPVRLGVSSGGQQAVSAVHPGGLRAGDLVVLGIGSAK